ncbi:MAG: hypothetical protein PWQ10_510, partial [Patescibacteria group bacterium]|nr:hypothetical protein [Patescibacteria group bacterium]
MHKYLGRQINRQSKGYTIVELAVIISVIGILAAITIVSYSGWRKYSIETQLKSDLSGVASAMKNALTFNNAYPAEVPSTFEPSDGVTLTGGGSADGKSYCVSAVSSSDVAIVYHIDSYSTGDSAQVGGCTPITIPITSISSITGTPQVFQTLTAGTITPSDATVSYQWQSSTTSDGTYTDIANETNNTYVVSPSVMGKYIKVVVTGTGSYTGTKTSTTSTAIAIDSNWLTIGTQTWAKKNLNVGTKIAGTTEQTNNSTIEKYCYNNDEANCTTYGALYQWDEAMQYTNTEG